MFSANTDKHPAWFCTVWTGNGNTHHKSRSSPTVLPENQKWLWSRITEFHNKIMLLTITKHKHIRKDFLSCFPPRTDLLYLLLKCYFIKGLTYRSSSTLKNRFMFKVSCIIYSRCQSLPGQAHTNQSIPLLDLSAFSVNCIHTQRQAIENQGTIWIPLS